jgi:hypothetical protein
MKFRLHLSLLLILILVTALPAPASAQRRGRWRPVREMPVERFLREPPRIGATIGVDVTQIHMSDNFTGDDTDYRTGPHLGVLYSVGLDGRTPIRFETGIVYERKGGAIGGGAFPARRDILDEHYLTFPVLLEIPLAPTPMRPFVKIGPELSVLLSGKGRTDTFDDRGFLIDRVEYDPRLHDLDVGVRFGGGVEFPLGVSAVGAIEGACVFGLPNISDVEVYAPDTPFSGWPNLHNRALLLSFTIFGLMGR